MGISSGMGSRADDSALQPCSVPRVQLYGVQLHEVLFGHDADRALHLPNPPAKVLIVLGATKQRDTERTRGEERQRKRGKRESKTE